LLLDEAGSAAYLGGLWMSRFGALASRIVRLPVETQAMELGLRVGKGELRPSQAERLHLFLTLERLGLGLECYPRPIYAARRREAAKLGYGANDVSAGLEVELGELLQPYRDVVGLDRAA
jgi:hypothetical protein